MFYGNYDGGEYTISNYSYVDPNFSTSNACETSAGLFGYCAGEYLKNIRLSGVWTIQGFNKYAGFLVGHYSNNTGVISNIEGNFSTGTFMDTNSVSTFMYVGSIFGTVTLKDASSITVRGTVDFQQDTQNTDYAGGIAAIFKAYAGHLTLVRNLASFPSGISGSRAGGLFGQLVFFDGTTLEAGLNAMIGDVFSNHPTRAAYVGGVIGNYYAATSVGSFLNNIVNSMTGDVYATTNDAYIGGLQLLLLVGFPEN